MPRAGSSTPAGVERESRGRGRRPTPARSARRARDSSAAAGCRSTIRRRAAARRGRARGTTAGRHRGGRARHIAVIRRSARGSRIATVRSPGACSPLMRFRRACSIAASRFLRASAPASARRRTKWPAPARHRATHPRRSRAHSPPSASRRTAIRAEGRCGRDRTLCSAARRTRRRTWPTGSGAAYRRARRG